MSRWNWKRIRHILLGAAAVGGAVGGAILLLPVSLPAAVGVVASSLVGLGVSMPMIVGKVDAAVAAVETAPVELPKP